VLELLHIDTYQKATGFISFLQNNPDILLNPKRSIGISVGTLELDGSGLTLDLTNISNIRIQDIEKIDITGSGNNTLILNLNDVPAPALKTSMPPLPIRVSLPAPATKISSLLVPVRVLLFLSFLSLHRRRCQW
jgi:hypothetical protein